MGTPPQRLSFETFVTTFRCWYVPATCWVVPPCEWWPTMMTWTSSWRPLLWSLATILWSSPSISLVPRTTKFSTSFLLLILTKKVANGKKQHILQSCSWTVRDEFLSRLMLRRTGDWIKWIPSRELTYPPKMAFWRWFSFSQGGIC